jgi:hypothetical protein
MSKNVVIADSALGNFFPIKMRARRHTSILLDFIGLRDRRTFCYEQARIGLAMTLTRIRLV